MTTPTKALHMLLLGVVAAFALGGCRSAFLEGADQPPVQHRPRVEAFDLAHTAVRRVAGNQFDAAARAALDAFMARQPRTAQATVLVAAGVEGAMPAGETVAAWLRHRGHQPYGPVAVSGADMAVQVVVRRYAVTLPPCPDFTKYPGDTFDNAVHSNWGCATASNLGLMVADPGDLLEGRETGPANGEVQAEAFQRYLEGETKDLAPEDVGTVESAQPRSSGGGSGGGS